MAFVVDQNEGGEIHDVDFPDGFHAELRELDHFHVADVFLRQNCRRAANAAQIKAAVLVTGFRHLLASIALGDHHHAAASRLKQIHIRIHPTSRCGPEGTARVTFGLLRRPRVINRMLLEVIRQRLASVEPFLQLRMCNVASDDDRAGQQQTRCHRILLQVGEDLVHRSIQINPHSAVILAMTQLFRNVLERFEFQLLEINAALCNFALRLTIGAARDANTDRQ